MILFSMKINASSSLTSEFFGNVIAVKFLGNLVDVIYFCKLCNLLRILIKHVSVFTVVAF